MKQAAQEYLAERLSEEGLTYEETQNRDAAVALAPIVWREVAKKITEICDQGNTVTREESLSCKKTMMGDLRIRCATRSHQMVVRFEAARRLIRIDNTAR